MVASHCQVLGHAKLQLGQYGDTFGLSFASVNTFLHYRVLLCHWSLASHNMHSSQFVEPHQAFKHCQTFMSCGSQSGEADADAGIHPNHCDPQLQLHAWEELQLRFLVQPPPGWTWGWLWGGLLEHQWGPARHWRRCIGQGSETRIKDQKRVRIPRHRGGGSLKQDATLELSVSLENVSRDPTVPLAP